MLVVNMNMLSLLHALLITERNGAFLLFNFHFGSFPSKIACAFDLREVEQKNCSTLTVVK